MRGLIEILSEASEYENLPIRHKEEVVLKQVSILITIILKIVSFSFIKLLCFILRFLACNPCTMESTQSKIQQCSCQDQSVVTSSPVTFAVIS